MIKNSTVFSLRLKAINVHGFHETGIQMSACSPTLAGCGLQWSSLMDRLASLSLHRPLFYWLHLAHGIILGVGSGPRAPNVGQGHPVLLLLSRNVQFHMSDGLSEGSARMTSCHLKYNMAKTKLLVFSPLSLHTHHIHPIFLPNRLPLHCVTV